MTIPQHCVDDTASTMRALERSLDDAAILYGRLFGELITAQGEGKLHPMFMHSEIFARLPSLGASIIGARGDAVEVHKGMNRIALRLDLATTAVAGPPEDKTWPPKPPPFMQLPQASTASADA